MKELLEYGSEPSKRRARMWRIIAWGTVLVVAVYAAWPLVERLQKRLEFLRYQRWATSQISPASPVFASHGEGINGYYGGREEIGPDMWFGRMRQFYDPAPSTVRCIIYAHGIEDRHGNRYIVVIDLDNAGNYMVGHSPVPVVHMLRPGTLFRDPQLVTFTVDPFVFDFDLNKISPYDFNLYFGRPDPADPSQFTIDYELNGKRHTLFGGINEQDVLKIEKRKEPTSLP